MQPPSIPFPVHGFRSTALVALGIAGTLACSSPGTVPARPGPAPVPEATPTRPTGRWSLQREAGSARYEIRSVATIELAGDSVPGDSLSTAMIVSLAVADSGATLSVAGTIDSLGIARGTRITTQDSMPPLPIVLHGVLDRQGGVLQLGSPAATADSLCRAAVDPLVAVTRDLFVRLPQRLTSGTTWQDSTQATSCRGRLPVTTTTLATYTVLGEQVVAGRALLAIARSTTLSLAGGGEQHGRSATVQGTGSGSGTLLVDPETAALVDARSESTVTVTFEAGMLRQSFTQHGRQEIRRR